MDTVTTVVPKVLVLEDALDTCGLLKLQLEGEAELVFANSIEEARKNFTENPEIAAIVVDGCLSSDTLDTEPLVREFRATFHGPMIASSGDPYHRQQLINVGCNYECAKECIAIKLREILDLKPSLPLQSPVLT